VKSKFIFCILFIFSIGSIAQPVIENPQLTNNPENVLRAIMSFTTDVPTEALVVLYNDEHTITVKSTQGLVSEHEIDIIGLHPQEKYTVSISVVDINGNTTYAHSLQLETSDLPEDFPPIEITISDPAKMQPGITFFNVMRLTPNQDNKWGYIVAVDEQGKVVWYHKDIGRSSAVSQLQNQNLLYLLDGSAVEMDMLGNQKHVWTPEQLTPAINENFHHDVTEMPSGNLLALSREFRKIDGYTDENGQPITREIRGDVFVEFTTEGKVVNQWTTFDMLDPYRIKYGLDTPLDKAVDWTHGNSVFYDERDDSIIASLRTQDWVIKFDRSTGDLLWKLGEDGDFVMNGDGEWHFQQHAARFLADGSLIMYDNGKERTGIDDPNDFYTRAVQYQLDTSSDDSSKWTATQLWEFRDDEDFYGPFLGEVDHLANGNFLIADGGRTTDPTLSIGDPNNQKWARIIEVTPTASSEKVFELIIKGDGIENGYSVYRSERLNNLSLANLGATVYFTEPAQIPIGMELNELLPSIESEMNQPTSIDLSVDIFANGTNILETINTLPILHSSGWVLNQDTTQGYLQLDTENLRFAAHPWKISRTSDEAVVQVGTGQTLQIITHDGIEVIAQPAVQHSEALQIALQKLDLSKYTIQQNGNMKIPDSDTDWYSVRPDLVSLEVDEDSETGLFATTLPVFFVFEDKDGEKRQQYFYPAPADIDALYVAAKQIKFNQGILSFEWEGKNYQGLLDYAVLQEDKIGSLQISSIMDKNSDESDNYLIKYPNGEVQKLFAPAN